MNPQQELFTFIRVKIEAMGYDVYDGFYRLRARLIRLSILARLRRRMKRTSRR